MELLDSAECCVYPSARSSEGAVEKKVRINEG